MASGIDIKNLKQTRRKGKGKQNKNPTESFSIQQLLNLDISFSSGGLSDKVKEEFYLGIYSMVSSGIAIKSAVELILQEEKKKKIKEYFQLLDDELIKGHSLSHAMRLSNAFTPYEYFSIQIGEETGRLAEVIEELASYYTSRLKQKRQFISAMSYPAIVLITSFGAVSFLLLFMVPMFENIFSRFGGELPGITRSVISFSNFIKDNVFWILGFFCGIGVGYLMIRNKSWFKQRADTWLIKVPLFGQIYFGVIMARFCKSMSLLIASKVPLVQCLDLMKDMISFYPIKKAINTISEDLFNGKSLHDSMSSHAIFSSKLVTMVKIGEEVNQLDVFFKKIGENYTNETEFKTAQLNTFLEPVLIIFLAIVVGFILVTMYLPMFEISTNLGM